MLHGFASMLISLWERERPRTLFVGFDTLTSPTYRHELLPVYQSGREFPPELTSQLDRLPEWVEAFGFSYGKEAGYEADDFVAAAALSEEERGGDTLVVTSDRDLFQLATAHTARLAARMRAVRCFTPRTLSPEPSPVRYTAPPFCSVCEKPTR